MTTEDRYWIFMETHQDLEKILMIANRQIQLKAQDGYRIIYFHQDFSFWGKGWWYVLIMELQPQPTAEVQE